jgi:hypothetical protein
MEKQGQAINATGKVTGSLLKVTLYLLWGASRILEVTLSELNKFLKRVLEQRRA